MKLWRTFLWMLALLPLTACGLSGGPIDGQVLEVGTRKPIAGAIVTVTWQGSFFQIAESRTTCYHVESATTDQQGHYKIAKWHEFTKGPFFSQGPFWIEVYKPGYEHYLPPGNFDRTEDYKNNIRFLAEFKGAREERLKYLSRLSEATRCSSAGDSVKNVLAFRKALHLEANNMASSKEDMDIVEGLLFQEEIVEFGYEIAERNQVQRYRGKK